jgi:hypothetical protein
MEPRSYPLKGEELELAKQHLRWTIKVLKSGGIWVIPATGTAYKIDKTRRGLIHMFGPIDLLTIQTAQAIGWIVVFKE